MFKKKNALQVETHITEEKFGSVIGPRTRVVGDWTAEESLRIDGQLQGNILGDTVPGIGIVVGEKGLVTGDVRAERLLVAGKVQGSIWASKAVELYPHAVVEGDVECASLAIAHGAQVVGRIRTTLPETKPAEGAAVLSATTDADAKGTEAADNRAP